MAISVIFTVLMIVLALGFTLNGVRSINNSFEQYLEINQARINALHTMYGEEAANVLANIATAELARLAEHLRKQVGLFKL